MANENPLHSISSSGVLRRASRWIGYPLAVVVGFGIAYFVMGAFPTLLGHRPGSTKQDHQADMAEGRASHEPSGQLWTCGMHPQVIMQQPGTCPICGMNLVPVGGTGRSQTATLGEEKPSGERKVLFYRNPMNPSVTSPEPMKDAMGMDYVPVYADEVQSAASAGPVVSIDPAVVQNMGVLTEKVLRRDLARSVRTVGYLGYDQEKMVSVTTRYEGFVEKVYVNYLGQPVNKGDPLFEIYSPELVQTQQELLSAMEFARRMKDAPEDARRRAESLVAAAKARLSYWDVTPEQLSRLEESGQVSRTLAVVAPIGGLVMKRMDGLEGMAVRPGMDVIHIADLSSLWLEVEVFENQLPWLRPGSAATATLSYFPGEEFTGRIRYIEPAVSEKTRTVKVTFELPNPEGKLRVGMYATVECQPVIAPEAIAVPSHSILRTGSRNVVIVALGGGRFAPREVTLGFEGEGWVQVLAGLDVGEEIVTSSQFLINSESNLREAIQKMAIGHNGHEF